MDCQVLCPFTFLQKGGRQQVLCFNNKVRRGKDLIPVKCVYAPVTEAADRVDLVLLPLFVGSFIWFFYCYSVLCVHLVLQSY